MTHRHHLLAAGHGIRARAKKREFERLDPADGVIADQLIERYATAANVS
jgi:hypothetical protein